MIKTSSLPNRQNSRGFSLLEVLLALAVFVVMMTGIVQIMRDFTEREVARSGAAYMESIMEAMTEILNNPTTFLTLYHAAVESGGGYQLVADGSPTAPTSNNILRQMDILTLGMGSTVSIPPTTVLNQNFRNVSPLRTPVRILIRPANPAGTPPAIEVIIVTTEPRPIGLVQKAASEGKFEGGYIETYNGGRGNARLKNAFNSWTLNLSSGLGNTPWYTANLPDALDNRVDGSFLAYYSFFSYSTITSDYLFRVRDPHPTLELNTMHVPLKMNGNNLLGVDDFNIGDAGGDAIIASGGIDPLCDGTRLCVNGTAIVKGSTQVGGNMTVRGNAMIADSATVNALRVENAFTDTERLTYGAQGHLMVDGNSSGSTNDFVNVRGAALFEDGTVIQTGNLSDIETVGLTMPPGGTLETGTGLAYRISGSGITANEFHAEGPVRAGAVTGGFTSITAADPAARTGVIDVNDMTHMQIGWDPDPTTVAAPAEVQRLNVQKLSVSRFGACNDCPR